jgi:hypothetical protein
MNRETHTSDPLPGFRIPHFNSLCDDAGREQIDSQLSLLRNRIQELLETASADASPVGRRIHALLEELLVKQEAICWKLRVAKRFQGDARVTFMTDILESVDRLRIAIDLVTRAYSDVLQVI